MSEAVQEALRQVYSSLSGGNMNAVGQSLEQILALDLDNNEIQYALSCTDFWKNKLERLNDYGTAFEKGERIFIDWESFKRCIQKFDERYERCDRCLDAFRQYVFSRALELYNEALNEKHGGAEPEIFRKIGLCYKCLGNYERAMEFLNGASLADPGGAAITAELADSYALFGETRMAKVLFREAFFIDPQAINLAVLESEMIRSLIRKTENLGYKEKELAEWTPVYGNLFGVFNVKRELRAVELGKLKQSCFILENQIAEEKEETRKLLKPRLINHYFWLIDHYVNSGNDWAKINELLLKIKILDPAVYKQYNM